MCGIAGFVGAGSPDDLDKMCAAMVHRGPDDKGVWLNDSGARPIAFGFQRLTILDAEGGRQPMVDSDRGNAVVFNGEIYNHAELRRQLSDLGATFRSDHSDTEVLLHAYAQWGEEMLVKLNGMFAFALYDQSKGQVLLARDRFAKKPLYVHSDHGGGLVFASEMTALAKHSSMSGVIDPQALIQFFAFGYVPPPGSLYQGVAKLHGGEAAIFDIAAGSLKIWPYWNYRIRPNEEPPGSLDDWAGDVLDLLRKAVHRRLEADVPLGFFLSGGVDSATVVALAREALGPEATLDTFTIGFDDQSYDESAAARELAAHFGARHHEKTLDLGGSLDLLDEILGAVDEPVSDPSILPTYMLSQFARKTVTVAISGDGGDELFAGYDTFSALNMARAYDALVPKALHGAVRWAAELLPLKTSNMSFDFKLRRALRGLSHRPAVWQPAWLGPAGIDELSEMFGEELDADSVYKDVIALWDQSGSSDPHDRLLEFYANYYLPSDILAKVDRASMLNSLEVRSPFLDRDLAEYCLRLPYRAKQRGRQRKWILRKAIEGLVPPSVLERKKKGFGIPVADWLRKWPIPDSGRTTDLGIDYDILAKKWKDHAQGKSDHRGLLFAWVCMDRWFAANGKL
jgi:asparagine synthase (glutamine-hydrolysing)